MISPSASRTSCQANGIPCSFFLFFFFLVFLFFLFIITTNYGFNSGPSDRTSTCFTDTLSTALPLVGKPEKSEWMNRQRTNKQRETRSQSLIRSVTSPTGCIFLPSIFLFSLLSLSFFFPVSFFFFLLIHQSVDILFPFRFFIELECSLQICRAFKRFVEKFFHRSVKWLHPILNRCQTRVLIFVVARTRVNVRWIAHLHP